MKKTKAGRSSSGKTQVQQKPVVQIPTGPENPLKPAPMLFKVLFGAFALWVVWLVYLY